MNARVMRALGLAAALGSVLVWVLLEPLHWAPRAFTTFLLVPLPALLVLQARMLHSLPQDSEREAVYISSALSVWILAALAMVAARFGGLTRADLRLVDPGLWTLLLATLLTVAAGVALLAAGRALRVRESPLVDYLLPRTPTEKIAFAGVSLSAGIAEELVFRSFLFAVLAAAGASLAAAAVISIAAFAVAHAYQGLGGGIRVALLGAVLTAPFLLTGSVYPAMLAHIALDLIAGLVLADWLMAPSRH